MKKSVAHSISVLRFAPVAAAIILTIAGNAHGDTSAKCPNPRPANMSDQQRYVCANDDLEDAQEKMVPLVLTQDCDYDSTCVQKRVNEVNRRLEDASFLYSQLSSAPNKESLRNDLKIVHDKLNSIVPFCGTNPPNGFTQCIQDKGFSDSATANDVSVKAWEDFQDLTSHKAPPPNPVQQRYNALQTAKELIDHSLYPKTPVDKNGHPTDKDTCYTTSSPNTDCMDGFFKKAISALNLQNDPNPTETAALKKVLQDAMNNCKVDFNEKFDCYQRAVNSAEALIDQQSTELSKSPTLAHGNSSSKPGMKKSVPKWDDPTVSPADRMAALTDRNQKDQATIAHLQFEMAQQSSHTCPPSDQIDLSGMLSGAGDVLSSVMNDSGNTTGGSPKVQGPQLSNPGEFQYDFSTYYRNNGYNWNVYPSFKFNTSGGAPSGNNPQ